MPDLPAIIADEHDMRLDRYLRERFTKLSLGTINRALRQRQVRLNNKRIKGDVRVTEGDIVHVPAFFLETRSPSAPKLAKIDPKVQQRLEEMLVAEQEGFFVLNKPQGLAVQGGGGVRWHVDRMLPTLAMMHDDAPDSLRIVHRLDKETSGLLLIARGRKSATLLAKQFQQRCVKKFYLALCHGVPEITEGTINAPLGKCADFCYRPSGRDARPAQTHYRIHDQVLSVASTLLLSPVTGRTHQLRAHLAHIGHPILGDQLYGQQDQHDHQHLVEDKHHQGGMALHAAALQLPIFSNALFVQPPPPHFHARAKALGLDIPSTKQLRSILLQVF